MLEYIPTDPIEGSWHPLRAEMDGERAPEMALDAMELRLEEGRYTIFYGGEASDAGTYSLNGQENPASGVLQGRSGTNAGRTTPLIYQLHGDRLRVCFGLQGSRPSTFTAAAGSGHYLVTYRRAAVSERRAP